MLQIIQQSTTDDNRRAEILGKVVLVRDRQTCSLRETNDIYRSPFQGTKLLYLFTSHNFRGSVEDELSFGDARSAFLTLFYFGKYIRLI